MKSILRVAAAAVVAFNLAVASSASACGHPGRFGGCLAHGHFDPTVREHATENSPHVQRHNKLQRFPKWTTHHVASAPHGRRPSVAGKW
jgi:hypothetical protein